MLKQEIQAISTTAVLSVIAVGQLAGVAGRLIFGIFLVTLPGEAARRLMLKPP